MAEGGYDPKDETTDKDPLIPGTGDVTMMMMTPGLTLTWTKLQ